MNRNKTAAKIPTAGRMCMPAKLDKPGIRAIKIEKGGCPGKFPGCTGEQTSAPKSEATLPKNVNQKPAESRRSSAPVLKLTI
jgi:hypothetical protein